jgi:hypothetical protein
MSRVPAILFIQLFFSLTVLSQRAIKGRVVDAASGDAIPGSSVFINNSSKGVISDKAGQFEMRDVPAGNHELIISSIGYETSVFSFSSDQLPLQLKIELRVKVRELQNVTVEPSVEEGWDKWGRMFSESFIGNTPNALHCKIKNPRAIRFRYYKKSNRVIAYSDEPIIVENKALGYIIRYQMEDFEVNFKSGTSSFAGYPFFEEMDKSRKKWGRNREKAYSGSMMHFMRSVYNNQLTGEGFEVRRMRKVLNTEKERVKKIYALLRHSGDSDISKNKLDSLQKDSVDYYQRVLRQKDYTEVYESATLSSDSLVVKNEAGYKIIFFSDYLFITYKKEMEDRSYLDFFHEKRSPAFQRSYIWLTNGNAVGIDANGSYYPPQEIFSTAYWGWKEKMANMLPLDYWPGTKE